MDVKIRSRKKSHGVSENIELELFKCNNTNQVLIQIGPNKVGVNGASNKSLTKLTLGTFVDLCK